MPKDLSFVENGFLISEACFNCVVQLLYTVHTQHIDPRKFLLRVVKRQTDIRLQISLCSSHWKQLPVQRRSDSQELLTKTYQEEGAEAFSLPQTSAWPRCHCSDRRVPKSLM